MDKGFTEQKAYAYKTPRRKTGVLLPAVPPKPLSVERRHPDCYGCWGCGEPHPSQKYHMQQGGCLYDAELEKYYESVMDAVAMDLGKN